MKKFILFGDCWLHEDHISPKVSHKSSSPFHSPPSLSFTILSHLNSLSPSHLSTTAMTTSHLETVTKQDAKSELLYCPLPLPMPLSLVSLLSSSVFVYLLPFKSVLCGAGTTPYMHLQRRLWELDSTAKIIAEIILFFLGLKLTSASLMASPQQKKCLCVCC